MNILAISGSLRAISSNTTVLQALARLAPDGVRVTIYTGLGELPHFNPDLDNERIPDLAAKFRSEVGVADGLIISSPEYAHGVPGSLKNALDWLVGSDAFAGKPTMLVNVAPRAFHAQAQLREILTTMAARIVPEACVIIPLGSRHDGAKAIAADDSLATKLREGLNGLLASI